MDPGRGLFGPRPTTALADRQDTQVLTTDKDDALGVYKVVRIWLLGTAVIHLNLFLLVDPP